MLCIVIKPPKYLVPTHLLAKFSTSLVFIQIVPWIECQLVTNDASGHARKLKVGNRALQHQDVFL